MSIFALTNLSVGVSCIVLSLFISYFGKTKLHYILLVFNIVVSVWGFGLFFVGISDSPTTALLSWEIAHLGGFLVAPIFYHLIVSFCQIHRPKIILFVYLQAVFFIIISFTTDLLFQDYRVIYDIYYLKADAFYSIGVFCYLFFVCLSFFELVRFLPKSEGHQRQQARYILNGFMFGFIGATLIFPPMYNIAILYPFTNIGITIYCFILAYAILRYRLMDIQIVIKKSLIYSLAAGILTSIYLLLILIMTKYISYMTGWSSFSVTLLAAIILAFFFNPAKHASQRLIDKIFHENIYDYSALIKKISGDLSTMLELQPICFLIVDTLFDALKVEGVFLLKATGDNFSVTCLKSISSSFSDKNITIDSSVTINPGLLSCLMKQRETIAKEEVPLYCGKSEAGIVNDLLKPFEGEIITPVFLEGKLDFLLFLGKKISGDAFSSEDFNFLNTVANQSAIALNNAKLFADLDDAYKKLSREANEREKIEQNLRLSEELYRTLVDSAPF